MITNRVGTYWIQDRLGARATPNKMTARLTDGATLGNHALPSLPAAFVPDVICAAVGPREAEWSAAMQVKSRDRRIDFLRIAVFPYANRSVVVYWKAEASR